MNYKENIASKKIIVIGSPGSGKSFVSSTLSKKLNIPIFYLDKLYWKENWVATPREQFIAIQQDILKKDSYIIDGNYQSTLELRFKNASTIIFLDIDKNVCFEAVKGRMGQKREDFPNYLEEELDDAFVHSILHFHEESRPFIMGMIDKYSEKNIIVLKNRDEVNEFLKD